MTLKEKDELADLILKNCFDSDMLIVRITEWVERKLAEAIKQAAEDAHHLGAEEQRSLMKCGHAEANRTASITGDGNYRFCLVCAWINLANTAPADPFCLHYDEDCKVWVGDYKGVFSQGNSLKECQEAVISSILLKASTMVALKTPDNPDDKPHP